MKYTTTPLTASLTKETRSPFQAKVNPLQSDIYLTLQTKHAQALVRGRDLPGKPPIIGLVGFADRLRLVWTGAQNNDPYADWWLIKIEEALTTSSKAIHQQHEEVIDKLKHTRSMRIAPAKSKEPFRFELRFATPYAFRAASVLAEFDEMTRDVLTARHIGVLSATACQFTVYEQARKIRALFMLPFIYRFLSLDRDRASSWEGVGKRAEILMGVIPPDIKDGQRRASLAPPIQRNTEMELPVIEDPETAKQMVFGD